jgi:hypothetical protein
VVPAEVPGRGCIELGIEIPENRKNAREFREEGLRIAEENELETVQPPERDHRNLSDGQVQLR